MAKLYLKFPHKWWPNDTSDIALLWNQSDRLDYEKQVRIVVILVHALIIDYVVILLGIMPIVIMNLFIRV